MSRKPELRRVLRRIAASKLLWSGAALLLLYALGGFVLAPYLIERYLPSLAEKHLGQRASVAAVRINPFVFTFEASGFRLEGGGDKQLLAFKRLFVDFELSSIVRRAWTFADIRLEGADLGLEIDRAGRLDLLDIIERLRSPRDPEQALPRFVMRHVAVDGSKVSLVDLSGATRAAAVMTPIDIELFDLGTLADHQGRYALEAKLPGGGTLTWKGALALQPIASTGELRMQGMKIETAWRFLRDELNLSQPRGDLTLAGHYDFNYEQGTAALAVSAFQAELSGLFLAVRDEKRPLLALRTIRVSNASFDLAKRELVVPSLLLTDGTLNASISESGVLDWQQIGPSAESGTAQADMKAQKPPGAQPWRLRLQSITVEKVALDYADRSKKPELAVRTAALNGDLDLDVTMSAGSARVVADRIRLALGATAVTTPGVDTPFATLEAFTLAGGRIDTQARAFNAKSVAISGGDFKVALGPEGPIGLLQIFSAPATAGAGAAAVTAEPQAQTTSPSRRSRKRAKRQARDREPTVAQPWRVQLEKVGIEKVAILYTDGRRKPALAVRVAELNGDFSLGATAGTGSHIVAKDLRLALNRIVLAAPGTDAPLATLDSFAIGGARVDTGERSVRAKTVAMSGGGIKIARGPDGAAGLLEALLPGKPKGSARARSSPAAPAENAWQYRVDALAMKRFAVALSDRTYKPAIAYDLDVMSVAATNIASGSRTPIAFETELRIGGGTASGKGTLTQDFGGARAAVEVKRIALEPLRALVTRHAALELKSGNISASAQLAYRRGAEPALTASGQASVEDFLVNEAGSGERFASWKALFGDDVALSLSPGQLAIREMRLLEPGAKIVIFKDRTINLTQVLRKDPGSERAAATPAPTAPAAASAQTPAFPFEIGRIRIERGTLDFADLSLVLPFATRVEALGGSIVGISSAPQARAELELAGQIDTYGEARAEGVLIPRSPTTFLDIKAHFDNVEMPLLSPYSATFAGRTVAAGKLSLTLEYKIVNSQLAGENRIVLRDFKLGERVKAPDALDLPLDLAIALLKDSQGRISLAVPVRGNVGSPEFDYGAVIRGAIGNAIGRVVTAPFRMLAGLFGKSDAEEIRRVEFMPGSDRISPPQREQLDALAKALKQRPQLKLVVRGPYDAGRDAEELRRSLARLELAGKLGAKVRSGEDSGPIAYGSADTQKALEALLTQRAGPDAVRELASAYAKRTGNPPGRVNPLLGLFGRGSRDRAFYEAMFERLVEVEPLSDTAPPTLAASRANAIVETLVKAGIDRNRLQSGGISQVKAGSGPTIAAELAVDVMPGGS